MENADARVQFVEGDEHLSQGSWWLAVTLNAAWLFTEGEFHQRIQSSVDAQARLLEVAERCARRPGDFEDQEGGTHLCNYSHSGTFQRQLARKNDNLYKNITRIVIPVRKYAQHARVLH